jgi:succinylarginine dihydrolase
LREANFDGLVGPTHNYAGLSFGNVASSRHAGRVAKPREAALQGLAKMRRLMDMGLAQGVLAPNARPALDVARALGFSGSDAQILAALGKEDPVLLGQLCSASSMWAANAATVSPSTDTADGKVHFTPANLKSMLHRAIEPAQTGAILRATFADERRFVIHPPLPAADALGDEGAANHTRLFDDRVASRPGAGVHLFVYGVHHADRAGSRPRRYPARQTLEACKAVARLHGLDRRRCVFAQQSPKAIDAGAFHNDVVCVGNGRTLFYHEDAFLDERSVLKALSALVGGFRPVRVSRQSVSLSVAVRTYLFNAQLVTLPESAQDGTVGGEGLRLIAPSEAAESRTTRRVLQTLFGGGDATEAIGDHAVMDVRESMRNGGGPACLRLRVPLTEAEMRGVTQGCWCTPAQIDRLEAWVKRWYRAKLTPADLASVTLHEEAQESLDELTTILELGRVYPFQR